MSACDVVVIGAGPAGCAAAIRLAENGHDVVLLEREVGVPDDDRTSGECIPPSTQVELELLGIPTAGDWVLDHFAATRNVFPDGRWITFPFPDGFRYYNVAPPGSRSRAARACRCRRRGAAQRRACRATSSSVTDGVVVRGDDDDVSSATVAHRRGRSQRADAASARSEGRRARSAPDRRRACSSTEFDDHVPHTWDRHFYGERGAMISGGRIAGGQVPLRPRSGLVRTARLGPQADRLLRRRRPQARSVDHRAAGAADARARVVDGADRLPRARARRVTGSCSSAMPPATSRRSPVRASSSRCARPGSRRRLPTRPCATTTCRRPRSRRTSTATSTEVAGQVAVLRLLLAKFRDRELLLRCPDDRDALHELLGPIADQPGEERGKL